MSLLDLAERCEAASGLDRELDALIWLACTPGATRKEKRYIHGFSGKECVIDETREASGRLIVVPTYTGSLDAAMSLVPEGWTGLIPVTGGDEAWLWPKGGTFKGFRVNAATPALALTVACLRARNSEHGA